MNTLLQRYLKKLNLDETNPPMNAESWQSFLSMTSRLFDEAEVDRRMMERSLEKSSTELTTLNENLKTESEKLSRSNQELGQFAYVASHDLQAPLRMVTSYMQLLKMRYQEKLDVTGNEYIGFAIDGAKRMQHLIIDLLEYSRVGSDAKPRVELNVEVALKRAMKNLEIAIIETGAQITCEPMPTVLADEVQLERLFQNLIGNAIKYRPKDVKPNIHISAKPGKGAWEFSVRDNGIGIDKKDFDLIFQIFQRLHTSSEYSGTGIGLSVCQKIAQNHGGKIWVESEPGKGSNFQFTISA